MADLSPQEGTSFSAHAQSAIVISGEEAARLGHREISSEHLLLALIEEDGSVASRVLAELGLDVHRVREMVERLHPPDPQTEGPLQKPKPGKEFEELIRLASDERRRMGHGQLDTEHILLALVRMDTGIGIDVLKRLGVTPEQIRRQVRRFLQQMPVLRPNSFSFSLPASRETLSIPPDPDVIRALVRSWAGKSSGEPDTGDGISKNQSLATSPTHQLQARISLPSIEEMAIRLVPSFALERLEEYRSDEGIALLLAGLFAGGALGLLTDVVTQEAIAFSPPVVALLILLSILALASICWVRRIKNRAGQVRESILANDRNLPQTDRN